MGWVQPLQLPSGVMTRTFGFPVKSAGVDLSKRREPPALGADTDECAATEPRTPAPVHRRMTSLVGGAWQDKDEAATVEVGAELLGELVAQDDWLPESMAECPPHGYPQNLLWCDPFERFSVVSFVWAPGAKTPVHDHRCGAWSACCAARRRRKPLSVTRDRRADAGRVLDPGARRCRDPAADDRRHPPGDERLDDCGSISIHVYGGNIGAVRRHTFDPATGKPSLFVSGYTNQIVPNLWDRSAEVRAAG